MRLGDNVRCFNTNRRSKLLAMFGAPAVNGDAGQIVEIHKRRDDTIFVLALHDGRRVASHITNTLDDAAKPPVYVTLSEAMIELRCAGMHLVKMTKSYKRNGHRDVLIEGFMIVNSVEERQPQARAERVERALGPLVKKLRIEDGDLSRTWAIYSDTLTKIEMFCEVQ